MDKFMFLIVFPDSSNNISFLNYVVIMQTVCILPICNIFDGIKI